jgi:hypothetical protein
MSTLEPWARTNGFLERLTQIKDLESVATHVSGVGFLTLITRITMVQTEQQSTVSPPASIVTNLGDLARKRVEAATTLQAELFKELQEIGQYWSARAKTEADLVSGLIGRLTSARSVPESAQAYQEWASQWMSMTVEDSQHLVADGFKLAQTAARSLSNGSGGSG